MTRASRAAVPGTHPARTGFRRRLGVAGVVAATGLSAAGLVVTTAPVVRADTPNVAPLGVNQIWQQNLPGGVAVAESSPNVATLDGGGPAVVVGDRGGRVWAFHLANGSGVAGWPASTGGAPVDSTPSVLPNGAGTDNVYVGSGNAANPFTGGYEGFANTGSPIWFTHATDGLGNHGVQASMAVGILQNQLSVAAPSIGMNDYALNAGSGGVLPGWPFFNADSGFSTPAIASVGGQNVVIQGNDSTAGGTYTNGGHLHVIGQGGNLVCNRDFNQTIDSSPAVGPFLGHGQTGIAFGTGSYWQGASDTNMVYATDTNCNVVWGRNLGGASMAPGAFGTYSSPALGDVTGSGAVDVVEGVDTGTSGLVWALDGATGNVLPGWPQATSGRVIGSVVTADLTGSGYNDVLVPTTNGLVIFDGRSGAAVATLGQGLIALQNAPLVTKDPNGTTGITIAGYNGGGGIILHYEVVGSTGKSLGERSWPQFHQNPQLNGTLSVPAAPTLSQPVVGMASTADGQGYWDVASDGGIFAFGDAKFYGSTGGIALNRPIVGMARTPDGKGYWLVASDGGVFCFGDATFYGSTGAIGLNRPVVGIAPSPDGKGYWLVASDGGIFAFGDAAFHGSTGNLVLNRPVVGMAAAPNGQGYWLVASDGGIFNFGSAAFHGSTGNLPLNRPVVGMAPTNDGQGYWLVASDGGIFTFGDAVFHGSTGNIALAQPVVGMSVTPRGGGYWFAAADGGMFTFGDATFYGSVPGVLAAEAGFD